MRETEMEVLLCKNIKKNPEADAYERDRSLRHVVTDGDCCLSVLQCVCVCAWAGLCRPTGVQKGRVADQVCRSVRWVSEAASFLV